MPQTQFKASGINADNKTLLKEAGFGVDGVQWVNVNDDNIVVTHNDGFSASTFIAAINGADGNVNITE